jgi:hypothetical protein
MQEIVDLREKMVDCFPVFIVGGNGLILAFFFCATFHQNDNLLCKISETLANSEE